MATPAIVVDLAKDRIRIHRSTLNALQNPDFILLIVNPAEKYLGIMRGNESDPGVHRVKVVGKACYELYSKSLTHKFREVCTDWVPTGKYRMTGHIVTDTSDELVARFTMSEAIFTGTGKVT